MVFNSLGLQANKHEKEQYLQRRKSNTYKTSLENLFLWFPVRRDCDICYWTTVLNCSNSVKHLWTCTMKLINSHYLLKKPKLTVAFRCLGVNHEGVYSYLKGKGRKFLFKHLLIFPKLCSQTHHILSHIVKYFLNRLCIFYCSLCITTSKI